MGKKSKEIIFAERIAKYYDMMNKSKDPQLKKIAEELLKRELSSVEEREPEEIPESVFAESSVQEYIESAPENDISDKGDIDMTNATESKTEYRTQAKAGKTSKIENNLATITNRKYQNALSLFKAGEAYLQPINPDIVNDIKYNEETGEFYLNDVPQSKAQLKTTFSDHVPENIDLTFLQLCFSIILANFNGTIMEDNSLNLVVSIYYPALARVLGEERNTSRPYVEAFIDKIFEFQNLYGIISGEIQPVLLYAGEDREKGIIRLSSPYLTRVINKVYGASIRVDKNGNPRLKKNGEPLMLPSYSYLIHSSLSRERNRYAAENVRIIIQLIEQAGDNIPHISASSIVERNVQLSESLEDMNDTSNRNALLKRTFKKTWELLRTQTDIEKVYKDIQLPEPDDPNYLPSFKNLDKTVFEFPHKGKKGYR